MVAVAVTAVVGGCRDQASTGPGRTDPSEFATKLRLIAGNQQTGAVGTVLPELLSLRVTDAGGQPVAGAAVTWEVRSGGGTITPPAAASSVSGVVTAAWTLGTGLGENRAVAILARGYMLDTISFTATARVGAPTQLTLAAGNAQAGIAGSALGTPLDVKVQDAYGHPVSGARVTWATGNLSGTIAPTRDTTDATGHVTAVWTLGTAAVGQTATASLGVGTTPVSFTATATPTATRVMTIVSGNGQTGPAGAQMGSPIVVQVTDQFGNLISGQSVTFNDSLSAGVTVTPATATTDALGRASATVRLGGGLGPQLVRARVGAAGGATVPFTFAATVGFTQIYAGAFTACAVSEDDRVYCWGYGEDGQLGYSALKNRSAPAWAVSQTDSLNGPFLTLREVQGGRTYLCGITLGRDQYCWGRVRQVAPSAKAVKTVFGANVVQIRTGSASESFACLTLLAGTGYCVGSHEVGQLGSGAAIGSQNDALTAYVAIATGGLQLSSIAAGQLHACAMPVFDPAAAVATRTPRCWGLNSSGQLGNNTDFTTSSTPAPIALPAGAASGFEDGSLVSGASHSCAIGYAGGVPGAGGPAYCWGSNQYGQLGNSGATGAGARTNIATAVAGGTTFVRLYAGEYHTCGLTADGTAICWGANESGQLGIGSAGGPLSTPTAVSSGFRFRQLALGENFTCGITGTPTSGNISLTKGTVVCWGDNEFGQLGRGTAQNAAPVTSPGTAVLYQTP